MFRNYLKIAWRHLRKSRVYAFINIAGLASGMTAAFLIGLWVWDEITFDSYHKHYDRLAQVMVNQTSEGEIYTGSTIAMPVGEALRLHYRDNFRRISLVSFSGDDLVSIGTKRVTAKGIWAQADFPDMFTLEMVKGSRDALKDPSAMMISESLAKNLFGNEDPMNRVIRIVNRFDMKVAGVYRDLPANTTFAGTVMLLAWDNPQNSYLNTNKDWVDHNGQLFVELADGVSPEQATAKIRNLPTPHVKGWHEEVMVYPMNKLHLWADFSNGKATGGLILFVRLFIIVACFILLLACINFMNLSTARSEKRAKEVGIRKTMGSGRIQLVRQFLNESLLTALLAFLFATVLTLLFLPFFNRLSGKAIVIPWSNPVFWCIALGFILFTGIVAGSYPAFYLSGFRPVKVLKGIFKAGPYAAIPRQALVVLQFTVSVALIIGTIVVYRQIQYAKDRPTGYDRGGLISVPINTDELGQHLSAVSDDVLKTGVVSHIAESSQQVTGFNNNNQLDWRGKKPDQDAIFFRNVNVSADYGKTVGWKLVAGRDFSDAYGTDSSAMILNEAAVKIIGIKNPVGETMKFFGRDRVVVGVVKDMLTNSPYEQIEPALFIRDPYFYCMIIRIKPGLNMHHAVAALEPVFKKYNPSSPFIYSFPDDDYARKFDAEERIGSLATFFAVLAIFISCLGLFGLASFVAEQRTKEIGVRKVLGASVLQLWRLLSGEFVRLVLISLAIAMPLAWYLMHSWLQHYDYRTPISVWIFVASGGAALAITLLTVSFQSVKAALANPVRSLRSE